MEKGDFEEKTNRFAILNLGLSATRLAFPHVNYTSFPASLLQDKTRRGHHLFPIQTMR